MNSYVILNCVVYVSCKHEKKKKVCTSLILENFVDVGFIPIHVNVTQQKPHYQCDNLISLFN